MYFVYVYGLQSKSDSNVTDTITTINNGKDVYSYLFPSLSCPEEVEKKCLKYKIVICRQYVSLK